MVEYIVAVALLALAAVGIKKRKDIPDTHLLPTEDTSALKGFLCILIFFNHFSGFFTSFGPIFYMFNHTGHIMVAVFFFLSGYGIHNTYQKKNLRPVFLWKRFTKTMTPYGVCLAISVFANRWFNVFNKEVISVKTVLLSLLPFREIVENSWFVGAILFLYVLYYLTRIAAKKIDAAVVMCVVMLLFTFLIYPKWAPSFFAFPVGVLIAQYEARVITFLRSRGVITALLLSGLSLAAALLKIYGQKIESDTLQTLSDTGTVLLVPPAVYNCMFFVKPGNPALRFLGKISYEVYLIHGLSIHIAEMITGKENRAFFTICALGCTILLACCIHSISSAILSVLHKQPVKPAEKGVQ